MPSISRHFCAHEPKDPGGEDANPGILFYNSIKFTLFNSNPPQKKKKTREREVWISKN